MGSFLQHRSPHHFLRGNVGSRLDQELFIRLYHPEIGFGDGVVDDALLLEDTSLTVLGIFVISVADAFFRRIGLFCCLLCGICVQHTAVLGDVYNEGLGHDMMFRSGGLHHHIGSVGKLRGLNPAVLIREHFYYLILVSPKGCEPLPVPFCPFLVSRPLVKGSPLLSAEIVVVKGHNIIGAPGSV